MGHTEHKCWKKNGKCPFVSANFLEMLINDEEVTLTELNGLCGIKHNVFFGVRMLKHRILVQASTFGVEAQVPEDENRESKHLGINGNIIFVTLC